MYRRVFLALAMLLTLLGSASPALAQGRYPREHYYPNTRPLEGILPGIRSEYPGRFYDAEGPYPDSVGGLHYRIKWMTPDGRIIWLDADARTGRVIGPARNNWREAMPPAPPPPYGYGAPNVYGVPNGYGPPNGGQFGYGVRPGMRYPGGAMRGGWGVRGGGRGGRPHG